MKIFPTYLFNYENTFETLEYYAYKNLLQIKNPARIKYTIKHSTLLNNILNTTENINIKPENHTVNSLNNNILDNLNNIIKSNTNQNKTNVDINHMDIKNYNEPTNWEELVELLGYQPDVYSSNPFIKHKFDYVTLLQYFLERSQGKQHKSLAMSRMTFNSTNNTERFYDMALITTKKWQKNKGLNSAYDKINTLMRTKINKPLNNLFVVPNKLPTIKFSELESKYFDEYKYQDSISTNINDVRILRKADYALGGYSLWLEFDIIDDDCKKISSIEEIELKRQIMLAKLNKAIANEVVPHPTLIVNTVHSIHLYFVADEFITYDNQQFCLYALQFLFSTAISEPTDKACTNPERINRLPLGLQTCHDGTRLVQPVQWLNYPYRTTALINYLAQQVNNRYHEFKDFMNICDGTSNTSYFDCNGKLLFTSHYNASLNKKNLLQLTSAVIDKIYTHFNYHKRNMFYAYHRYNYKQLWTSVNTSDLLKRCNLIYQQYYTFSVAFIEILFQLLKYEHEHHAETYISIFEKYSINTIINRLYRYARYNEMASRLISITAEDWKLYMQVSAELSLYENAICFAFIRDKSITSTFLQHNIHTTADKNVKIRFLPCKKILNIYRHLISNNKYSYSADTNIIIPSYNEIIQDNFVNESFHIITNPYIHNVIKHNINNNTPIITNINEMSSNNSLSTYDINNTLTNIYAPSRDLPKINPLQDTLLQHNNIDNLFSNSAVNSDTFIHNRLTQNQLISNRSTPNELIQDKPAHNKSTEEKSIKNSLTPNQFTQNQLIYDKSAYTVSNTINTNKNIQLHQHNLHVLQMCPINIQYTNNNPILKAFYEKDSNTLRKLFNISSTILKQHSATSIAPNNIIKTILNDLGNKLIYIIPNMNYNNMLSQLNISNISTHNTSSNKYIKVSSPFYEDKHPSASIYTEQIQGIYCQRIHHFVNNKKRCYIEGNIIDVALFAGNFFQEELIYYLRNEYTNSSKKIPAEAIYKVALKKVLAFLIKDVLGYCVSLDTSSYISSKMSVNTDYSQIQYNPSTRKTNALISTHYNNNCNDINDNDQNNLLIKLINKYQQNNQILTALINIFNILRTFTVATSNLTSVKKLSMKLNSTSSIYKMHTVNSVKKYNILNNLYKYNELTALQQQKFTDLCNIYAVILNTYLTDINHTTVNNICVNIKNCINYKMFTLNYLQKLLYTNSYTISKRTLAYRLKDLFLINILQRQQSDSIFANYQKHLTNSTNQPNTHLNNQSIEQYAIENVYNPRVNNKHYTANFIRIAIPSFTNLKHISYELDKLIKYIIKHNKTFHKLNAQDYMNIYGINVLYRFKDTYHVNRFLFTDNKSKFIQQQSIQPQSIKKRFIKTRFIRKRFIRKKFIQIRSIKQKLLKKKYTIKSSSNISSRTFIYEPASYENLLYQFIQQDLMQFNIQNCLLDILSNKSNLHTTNYISNSFIKRLAEFDQLNKFNRKNIYLSKLQHLVKANKLNYSYLNDILFNFDQQQFIQNSSYRQQFLHKIIVLILPNINSLNEIDQYISKN